MEEVGRQSDFNHRSYLQRSQIADRPLIRWKTYKLLYLTALEGNPVLRSAPRASTCALWATASPGCKDTYLVFYPTCPGNWAQSNLPGPCRGLKAMSGSSFTCLP